MSDSNALAPWAQLQTLYVQQLIELGQPEVDLARVTALAGQSEALLIRLSSPEALRASAQDPESAQRISAAAGQAKLMLQRTTAALVLVRAKLLSRAQHSEKSLLATAAYRTKGGRTAARYLDQRR